MMKVGGALIGGCFLSLLIWAISTYKKREIEPKDSSGFESLENGAFENDGSLAVFKGEEGTNAGGS